MMLKFLQEYLRIGTSYPACNYDTAIALFKKQAEHDGFTTRIFALPSGYSVLVITLAGSDVSLPALGLNHHMDVVPAAIEDGWEADPFAGVCKDNLIIGRGTQDMKGIGVIHYAALRELKMKHKPKRTVHLLVVPDEERGGFRGTKEFVAHPEFSSLGLGYILDEGMPSGNPAELFIKIGERTPLQIQVTSIGQSAHSSRLHASNPCHELISFLHTLISLHAHAQKKAYADQAGQHISYQLTSLSAGNSSVLNCIPNCAQATIDIRIPSSIDFANIRSVLDKACQNYPGMTYSVLATSAERMAVASIESYFYKSLQTAIAQEGLIPRSFHFEATTDSRFYTNKNIEALGLTPFTCLPNLHGVNESITLDDFILGQHVIQTFLTLFCT